MTAVEEAGDERGIVMVWCVIWLIPLVIFMGLALDIGVYYLRAQTLQQAADSAALAGVVSLPDIGSATDDVNKALSRNSIASDPDIDVSVVPAGANRLRVRLKDNDVHTAFAAFLVDHIAITRVATAEYSRTIPMGSPFSSLGIGDDDVADMHGHAQGFNLAINGYCASKEDGDEFASRWDGNKRNGHTYCDGTNSELNEEYKPITALDGGYNFEIEVPVGGVPVSPGIFDGGFNPRATNGDRQAQSRYSADVDLGGSNDAPAHVTTVFRLYDMHNTPDKIEDDTLMEEPAEFPSEQPTGTPPTAAFALSYLQPWYPLVLGPGKYRLNVYTEANEPNSYGVNAFGLILKPQGNNNARYPDGTGVCDTRVSSWCPKVFGMGALSILTMSADAASPPNFYLGSVAKEYAGRKLSVNLWDPGEGAKQIRLVRPDEFCQPFVWSAAPAVGNGTGDNGRTTSESCDSDASALDVRGTRMAAPGRTSNAIFNDRPVSIETAVPQNYGAVIDASSTIGAQRNDWWYITYSMDGSNADIPADRTTWVMHAQTSSPIHLIDDNA